MREKDIDELFVKLLTTPEKAINKCSQTAEKATRVEAESRHNPVGHLLDDHGLEKLMGTCITRAPLPIEYCSKF